MAHMKISLISYKQIFLMDGEEAFWTKVERGKFFFNRVITVKNWRVFKYFLRKLDKSVFFTLGVKELAI